MAVDNYFIGGYWQLFYQWLLIVILLVAIDSYSIGGYWQLFYQWLLMDIGIYFIGGI